jgi:DHA1 family bicyclomycin/chloramphenicol resistance-like MFS transporter
VIATFIVRDCYAGRRMASVVSLAMMAFIAVPVVAPVVRPGPDAAHALARHLRGLDALWSCDPDLEFAAIARDAAGSERKAFSIREVVDAYRQMVTNRQTLGYALAAGGIQGSLFAFVFSAQQVFTGIYGLGHYSSRWRLRPPRRELPSPAF